MADELEKRIEESLRTYARKRREDAGAPMELHPANRRILQGEVAKRRAAQAPPRRPWWQSMFLVWPRFAAAVGMFAVLAAGVWVFTQSESQRANEAASTVASTDRALSEDAIMLKDREQAGAETDQLKSGDSLAKEAGKKLADGRSLDRLDEAKRELRDAESPAAPAMPAPTQPQLAREKQQEVRQNTPVPAQQPASLGVALQSADDKKMPEALLKKTEDRFYRTTDASAARPPADNQLGFAINTPITAGVSLAASKPVQSFYYQGVSTNLTPLVVDGTQLVPRFDATNALPGLAAYGVSVAAASPSGPPVAANEASQLGVNQQILSRSTRGVRLAEEAGVIGDQFERQDTVAQSAVLRNFELYQHGNGRLSIRDADGSLYEGQVVDAKADLDVAAKSKAETDELASSQNRRLAARLEDNVAVRAAAVRFRASGTNRNKELVVINGELLAETEQLGRAFATTPTTTAGKNVAQSSRPAAPSPTAAGQATPAKEQSGDGADRQVTARFGERTSGVTNSAPAFAPAEIRGRVQIGRANQQDFRATRSRSPGR